MWRLNPSLPLLLTLLLFASVPVEAQRLYVDADATGANSGASWADAFSDLQDALALAYAEAEVAPEGFALAEVYPNPFNPEAVVAFEMETASDVRVAVYDVLGREVAVLADRRFEAGAHSLRLDGSRLASGTYLVRASVGDAPVQVQRVTLLR